MSTTSSERAEIAKRIVKVLAAGPIIVAAAIIAPNAAGQVIPILAKRAKAKRRQANQGLRYALQNGWVVLRETRFGETEIALSEKGQQRWQRLQLNAPLKPHWWDRRWRIVIFDIPSKKKTARDALRATLKNLGFLQLQESVWVTPYRCQPEINALRTLYRLTADEVRLIEAAHFDGEERFKSKFGI